MTGSARLLSLLLLAGIIGCGQQPRETAHAPDEGVVMAQPPELGPAEDDWPDDGAASPDPGTGGEEPGADASDPGAMGGAAPDITYSAGPDTPSPLSLDPPDFTSSPDSGDDPGDAAEPPEAPQPGGSEPPDDGELELLAPLEPSLPEPRSPVIMIPQSNGYGTVAPVDAPEADEDYVQEKIYYGTDRIPEITPSERWATYATALRRFQLTLVIGLALCGAGFFIPQKKILVIIAAVLCLTSSAWFGRRAMLEHQQASLDDASQNRRYGNTIHFADGKHALERGYCWVSVPVKVHEQGSGELEEPGLFELRALPEKHFILQRVEQADRESFLENLRNDIQNSGPKHAFVFIHGYNVLFREAALRTAQLRYDLNFDGPAAFFSWPSNGSLLNYATDEETVSLTERSGVLHEFLTDFITETGAESIHLIAHSMGNRLLTRTFDKLPDARNSQGQKMINQLIMAAPDVNPKEFMLLSDQIRKLTRARTLYASEKDIALIGSEVLRMSTYTRLGQGGDSRVVVDGVQTIDASGLDREMFDLGHSYYVHPMVMQDLKHLLTARDISLMRPWLMSVDNYWIFRDR